MKTNRRKASATLIKIMSSTTEENKRRTRDRMLIAVMIADALGGNDATFGGDKSSVENRHMYAQALSMRAYAYFYLGQFFASGYDPSFKLCPLYKSLKEKDLPLSTMGEMFMLWLSKI